MGRFRRGNGVPAKAKSCQKRSHFHSVRPLNSPCEVRSSETTSDHPHAGGENAQEFRLSHPTRGPSPRGWGEQQGATIWSTETRTIPTRVGRTGQQIAESRNSADHPHAGGEDDGVGLGRQRRDGPSPRGWGERGENVANEPLPRTIPTRVGRTPPVWSNCRRQSDHPHAGGENAQVVEPFRGHSGPSPRGWGEQPILLLINVFQRTIPTRVGRTSPSVTRAHGCADHPHAGGENGFRKRQVDQLGGPSPRGWGELCPHARVTLQWRTIPTRVGRTSNAGNGYGIAADHPHAGGENFLFFTASPQNPGPSPRGWGELGNVFVFIAL